jgi:hypothetical protein
VATIDITDTGLRAIVDVRVLRRRRNTCNECGNRRVLYAVKIDTDPREDVDRLWRCKPCAGL